MSPCCRRACSMAPWLTGTLRGWSLKYIAVVPPTAWKTSQQTEEKRHRFGMTQHNVIRHNRVTNVSYSVTISNGYNGVSVKGVNVLHHTSRVVSTPASPQDGPGFESRSFLSGFGKSFPCLLIDIPWVSQFICHHSKLIPGQTQDTLAN